MFWRIASPCAADLAIHSKRPPVCRDISYAVNRPTLSRRGLLIAVSIVSLAIAAADAALWVRTRHGPSDYVKIRVTARGNVGFLSSGDLVRFHVSTHDVSADEPSAWERTALVGLGGPKRFDVDYGANGVGGHYVGLTMPHWALVAQAAIVPALWLWPRRKSRAAGMCKRCGYDLRATPDRCPECGMVTAWSA